MSVLSRLESRWTAPRLRLPSIRRSPPQLWHHGAFFGLLLLALSFSQAHIAGVPPPAPSGATAYASEAPSVSALVSDVSYATAETGSARRPSDLLIDADGRRVRYRSLAPTARAALAEAGIHLGYGDLIALDGSVADADTRLAHQPAMSSLASLAEAVSALPVWGGRKPDVRLEVQRPMLVQLHDGPLTVTVPTRETRVTAVLAGAGARLYPEDRISPRLDATVGTGGHITIERSKPVTLQTRDGVQRLRTLVPSVRDLLAERGVTLGPLDFALPDLDALIRSDLAVQVVRVAHRVWTEDEVVPIGTRTEPDAELELDQRREAPGQAGLLRHAMRAFIHDGEEVARKNEGTETVVEKRDHVVTYGTKVVWRTVDTPDGPKQYWRKFRVLATSYNASHGGKPRSSPGYGITATGMVAGKGVVAVDPRVIPLYTNLYVPGYGVAVAGDTGGAVKGRIVDLGFPEDVTDGWSTRYLDVYLLEPVPAWFPLLLP